MSLKSLFSKLVKNYGDDAAKLVANKGDDALATVGKSDNFLDGVTFLDDFAVPDSPRTSQQRLKDELLFKRSPAYLDVRDAVKGPSVVPDWVSDKTYDALHAVSDSPFFGGFPSTTSYLGDVVGQVGEDTALVPRRGLKN